MTHPPRWPTKAGRAPDVATIAKALVVAVGETGEHGILEAILRGELDGRAAILRAKRFAIEALHTLYPGTSLVQLGNVLGVNVSARWITAKPGWWTQAGVDRVIAGI